MVFLFSARDCLDALTTRVVIFAESVRNARRKSDGLLNQKDAGSARRWRVDPKNKKYKRLRKALRKRLLLNSDVLNIYLNNKNGQPDEQWRGLCRASKAMTPANPLSKKKA